MRVIFISRSTLTAIVVIVAALFFVVVNALFTQNTWPRFRLYTRMIFPYTRGRQMIKMRHNL